MQINTGTWETVDLHALAAITYAARPAQVEQGNLTVAMIEDRFRRFLSENPTQIVSVHSDAGLVGLLVLYVRNPTTLELSPGSLLGGHPVIAPDNNEQEVGGHLLEAAIAWARQVGFTKIEAITPLVAGEPGYQALYEAHGFTLRGQYVEMICRLPEPVPEVSLPPAGFALKPLSQASPAELFQCYYEAFNTGDAQFFFDQDEQERREYFDTLGYEEALNEPASVILLQDQQLVGFAFVLPYGAANCHISCMCVAAEWRGRGLGELILHAIMHQAVQQGCQTITLGTDIHMRAYELYRKNGFVVTEGSVTWQWRA